MAENSTLEYMNELHEYSEENEEVSVVVFSNENGEYSDVNDSDDQLDLEEIYLEEDEEGEQIEDETTATTQLKCDICDREFNTIVERNQHIEEHFKQIECPVCSRIFVGHSAFEFHTSKGKCKRATTKLQLFRCSLCNEKIFDSAKLLEKHIRDKHKCSINQNSISCEKCNRAFGKLKYLRKHIREIHEKATPFYCRTCGTRFNRKANLLEHELIHEGKYLAECETCGKSFRTHSGLNLHRRTHTGEKPYNCNLCEKAYAYNSDLKRHKRGAHGILSGAKPLPCPQCEKVFYEPKLLRNHTAKTHRNTQTP